MTAVRSARRHVTLPALLILMWCVAQPAHALTGSGAPQAEEDHARGQRDLGDIIAAALGRDDKQDDSTASDEHAGTRRFLVFPTFGGNPAVGFSAGALAALTHYSGDPSSTTLSSTLVSASVSTQKQVLVVARSDLYTRGNAWHLTGDWRYYDFTERTYGLGSDRTDSAPADVGYAWYRLHQVVSRAVWGGLEVGAGYHLDIRRDITPGDELPRAVRQNAAAASSTSSGASLNLAYDRRDHPLNPERGAYGRASYAFYRTGLGSGTNWESLQLEGRAYKKLPGRHRKVLSAWAIAWMTRAGLPPLFDLPSVGWDTYNRTARGYRAGRFRGRDWVYAEVEYRTDLTQNGLFGAVAFVNTSRFSDFETGKLQAWAPAAGMGFRIKLDKETRSNIALDFAWGRDGSRGLYLALNEAF